MTMLSRKPEKHVRFCSSNGNFVQAGTEAEKLTVSYLLDNLNPKNVGDFRILVNYNLPFNNRKGKGNLEIDLLLINKLGIFVIEVKDWHGSVDAYDGFWDQGKKYRHNDVFGVINHKARVLHTHVTREFPEFNKVSVVGIITLFRGKLNFKNYSHYSDDVVFGLDNDLIIALSSSRLLHYGKDSRLITDQEITRIANSLYDTRAEDIDEIIGHYRILDQLSAEEQFESFEAMDTVIETRRVRIKVFELPISANSSSKTAMAKITRDTEAVSKLGSHTNILQIYEFFTDPNQSNIFYEVTEPVRGERLDDIMFKYKGPIPFNIQIECITQICSALEHAHNLNIIHRKISPEVIYIEEGTKIKVADFDFAKMEGKATVNDPGSTFPTNSYSAPEMKYNPSIAKPTSDIYSLGVLWFTLANHPKQQPTNFSDNISSLPIPLEAKNLLKKMIAINPKERPQSARAVLEEILAIKNTISENPKIP